MDNRSTQIPHLKSEYLARPPVREFCNYLQSLIDGKPISHRYEVTWKRWKKYIGQPSLQFTTLKSAFDAYYWPTNSQIADDEIEDDDGEEDTAAELKIRHDWAANTERLNDLQMVIRAAIWSDVKDEQKAFIAALKILDWGQVYKGAMGWLIQEFDGHRLVDSLSRGTQILDGSDLQSTQQFRTNSPLRMDSGLTKVYSLASRRSVIYDDRVGAAIGLLVRWFLEEFPTHKFDNVQNIIPKELRFMRGSSGGRNPSVAKKYAFPGKKSGERHAQSNLMANWVIQEAVKGREVWGETDEGRKLRKIEAALFMLGYRVQKVAPTSVTP